MVTSSEDAFVFRLQTCVSGSSNPTATIVWRHNDQRLLVSHCCCCCCCVVVVIVDDVVNLNHYLSHCLLIVVDYVAVFFIFYQTYSKFF